MPSSCGFDADKTALRQQYLIMRRATSSVVRKDADMRIREAVEALPEYEAADLVLAYVSFADEIDTHRIIEDALAEGKTVAVPKCMKGHTLSFYTISSLADLVPGVMGILEPVPDKEHLVTPAMCKGSVCLVPGLVFDGEGYRIGYGAGYYDRFLAFYMGEKLGLARSMQVSSNPLPRGAHDIHVDTLVTDMGCFRISLR
ncbi:MAG: 5-formyltetrahydrofolate cyclo-ligase [Atopobiaceae bacterium]